MRRPGPIDSAPLELVEKPIPEPGEREISVRMSACGVCRTDLHIAEGDLAVHRSGVVPGHEVVGVVEGLGPGAALFAPGDRVGVAWLRFTCGRCDFCTSGRENLCRKSRYTGWDADGGYADYAVIDEAYAYALPQDGDDESLAPLLCAGIIGYRALRRSRLPEGGTLGIYGFGGSAHIAAQVALYEGASVYVMTRSPSARRLALDLGVQWVGDTGDSPPRALNAAIVFAPAGDIVPVVLNNLEWGGTLAVAGIHVTDVPPLDYQRHLFGERTLTSVTSNTRDDGREFLELATRSGVRPRTVSFGFEHAAEALRALARGEIRGAAVLRA